MFLKSIFSALILAALISAVNAQSYLTSADSAALLKLRFSSGGGSGVTAAGWMTTIQNQQPQGAWLPGVNPTYNWAGLVFTTDLNGNKRVKEINLSNLGLTDSLPSNLFFNGALDSLQVLNVSGNQLSSLGANPWFTIPNNKLRKIDISTNGFIYDPNILLRLCTNANALEELIAESYISPVSSGNFPNFPQLPNLRRLIMGRNLLNGAIPNPYNLSPALVELNLEANNFQSITSGTAPAQLQILNISYNDISSITDLRNVLATYPQLKIFNARDALDNGIQHNIQSLYTVISSPFSGGKIDIGSNNLSGALFLNNIELSKLREFNADFNQLSDIVQPTGQLDSLRTLNLSYNQIASRADTLQKLVMSIPKIEVFNLSNNRLWGRLPALTIQNAPQFPPYANLKNFNISNNQIYGRFKIGQLLGAQLTNTNGILQELDISNNLFDEVLFVNLNQTRFDSLRSVKVQGNKLSFKDLYNFVTGFDMQKVTGLSTYGYYAPANALNDSLAFDYQNQADRGVGGLKRRPANDKIYFDAQNPDPRDGLFNNLWNDVVWYLSVDTIIDPANDIVIGRFVNGNIQNNLNGFQVAPFILGSNRRNLLLAENLSQTIHGNKFYYAIVTNDSLPLVEIASKPKKIVIGDCYDFNGQIIKCQEIMISYDRDYLNTLTNPDSVLTTLKEDFGVTVIDSCLCNTYELWELSDTANALLLENLGTGTRTSSSQAGTKAELLSADPNYALLSSSANTYSPSNIFPVGTQHPNPTLVAIIDSGHEMDHSLLNSKIFVNALDANNNNSDDDSDCLVDNGWGWNFLDNTNYPFDDHGHGSGVAGIISGTSIYNIAANSGLDSLAILPLKYTNKEGNGTVFNAACAVRFAADFAKFNPNSTDSSKVRVINASWGYYGEPNQTLYNAIEYAARNSNLVFVSSAGNDGISNDTASHYPSNFDLPNILTVAASQTIYNSGNPDFLESYSNFGQQTVDIAAQGFDYSATLGNSISTVEGTSFAAAQVSRAIALLLHEYPDATYCAVIDVLMETADPLNSTDSSKIRSGRINFEKAKLVLDTMTNLTECSLLNSVKPERSLEQVSTALQNIIFYPNPVKNEMSLVFNNEILNDLKFELISFEGRKILQIQPDFGNQLTLELNHLPAGIYLLKMSNKASVRMEKIIKQP